MRSRNKQEVSPVNKNTLRWIGAVVLALMMSLLLSSPSQADVVPLDLDMNVFGRPMKKDGWISDTEYLDESIHAVVYSKPRKPKSSSKKVTCRWVVIEIATPSQLRTLFSGGSYESRQLERSNKLVARTNAVVAMNADFAKYTYDFGYIVRQGVFCRDALDQQKVPRDVLAIDNEGDLHVVKDASSADMTAFLESLESQGRTAVNTFTFGPGLIIDGEVQQIDLNGEHEAKLATQRICLCQLGPLKYAIVEVDGGNGTGINLQELANFIPEILPECQVAYNLDGGGSTHLYVNGKMIHRTPNGGRQISDIIYFASAAE